MSDIQTSPVAGLSFRTKGGRLLAQERPSVTSSTASQAQTPVTNTRTKTKSKARKKEDVLVKLPMFALIYKVVKTLSDLS